ncbi:MAG: hypothetical protein IH934_05895, partial [Nanoarchaeota archaeon]|nr:hypothetical protein [Nanoarchaeota archaeon]
MTTLIGPLIMAVLLGGAFNNTDAYSITVGIYASDYGDIENDIADKLSENFKVLKFNSEHSCLNALKDYSIHACIVLPKSISLKTNEVGKIIFYVDNSRINLVWLILDTLSNTQEMSSSEISTDLTNELLLKLNRAGVDILLLRNVTAQTIDENKNSLEQVNQINANISSLDMAEVQNRVEDSILRNDELKTALNSFISDINKKIDDGRDILSGLNSTISELDDIEDTLDDIEAVISNSNDTLLISGLSVLLTELDRDIFKIRETFSTILDKNNENKDSLAKALGHLKLAQELTQKINDEVNNLQVTNTSKIVNPLVT